jgi:hypothetical protein
MRHASHPAFIASLLVLLFMQHATAQVYQCLDTNGKKVFSQIPCAAQGGDGEKRIMRAPAGGTPAAGKPGVIHDSSAAAAEPRDWAAENAAANARAAAAAEASSGSRQGAPSAPGGLRKGNTPPSASDKQIIANCEANHGARCGSAGEIAQRRMEQRELTPAERQQQQNAVAARRYREQEEAFNRSNRR